MKYKKGSIVEVFVNDKFSHHSWRCAQIVSNNGDNYTVSYDIYPGFTNKEDVQQISIKSIRPSPPLLEIQESWAPGDIVEVFHNLSWKMAIVLKALNLEQFVVRLVGSSEELKVTKLELRLRQSFQNGEWIIIEKYKYGDAFCNNDTHSVTSSSGSCSINSYNNKAYEMYGGLGGVDDSDAESKYEMRYDDDDDDDDDVDNDDDDDDDDECVSLGDEIHRLELNAYRCTMEALHASGPLTWEKETMVTNLRMLLHISNDEHLIQIKNLISSASSNTCNR